MTPIDSAIQKIIEEEFACLGDRFCDWTPEKSKIPHSLQCPASRRYRAYKVVERVLREGAAKRRA